MESQRMGSLPGMRSLFEEEGRRLRQAQDAIQEVLTLHNYRLVETPVLERAEIYLRKSGGELASRMYAFVEPGGHRASLRPEFTAAVIRLFLERGAGGPLPVRWQYAGPVFRYSDAACPGLRQFTQVGAELVGAAGPRADAEVMALACRSLGSLGLEGLRLVIGSVGTFQGLLHQFQVSERAVLFLLRSAGSLAAAGGEEAVREQGARLGLFREESYGAELDTLSTYLAAEEAEHLSRHLASPPVEGPAGARPLQEIVARLRRRRQEGETAGRLADALAFAAAMSQLRGDPASTVGAARALSVRYGLDTAPIRLLEEGLEALELLELKGVQATVDMGLVRDIAYYTGLVFEVRDDSTGGGAFLAGGGRYDGLVKALGGDGDVPALGFACTLEAVVESLKSHPASLSPPRQPRRVMVAPGSGPAYRQALRVAGALRLGGEAVEVALEAATLGALVEDAASRGLEAVVLVQEDGTSERHWV